MKILLIHTFYQLKGGEDFVFEQEFDLLKKNNEVKSVVLNNKKGVKGAIQFVSSIWNIKIASQIKSEIIQFQPDVVHVHNLHFAASPIVLRTIKKMHIPIVVTLHNYRLLCPSATLLHNREVYNVSLKSVFPWQAVKDKVYRNSYFQTFWLAFINWTHRRINTWDKVDKYIVLTDFAKELVTKSSLNIDSSKLVIKPNFTRETIICLDTNVQKEGFLFVGRLSQEKGIECLLKAFSHNNYCLEIGGDGPLQKDVLELANANIKVNYRGNLSKKEVVYYMEKAQILISPSICYEGMPMTIIEAFSVGTPVIASNLGAMSSMITDGYNGFLFNAGDYEDLNTKLDLWNSLSTEEKQIMSQNAYNTYLENYTPDKNRELLMNIYQQAIERNKAKK